MTRLTRLKQLAERATGPWHNLEDSWYIAHPGEFSAEFIAEAKPSTVRALIETIEEMERAINSLYDSLKHGDETHQEWLKNHIAKHFSKALTGHRERWKE